MLLSVQKLWFTNIRSQIKVVTKHPTSNKILVTYHQLRCRNEQSRFLQMERRSQTAEDPAFFYLPTPSQAATPGSATSVTAQAYRESHDHRPRQSGMGKLCFNFYVHTRHDLTRAQLASRPRDRQYLHSSQSVHAWPDLFCFLDLVCRRPGRVVDARADLVCSLVLDFFLYSKVWGRAPFSCNFAVMLFLYHLWVVSTCPILRQKKR